LVQCKQATTGQKQVIAGFVVLQTISMQKEFKNFTHVDGILNQVVRMLAKLLKPALIMEAE
jgi:hypothetical protein